MFITACVILPFDLHHFGNLKREALDLASCRCLSAPSCHHIQTPCQRRCCQVESQSRPLRSDGVLLCPYPGGILLCARVQPRSTPHSCGSVSSLGPCQSSKLSTWSLQIWDVQEGDLGMRKEKEKTSLVSEFTAAALAGQQMVHTIQLAP